MSAFVEVNGNDLCNMMFFTVRYSLGRRSTASSICLELIGQYAKKLDAWQRNQLREEIHQALKTAEDRYQTLGDQCDHDTWYQAMTLLKESPGDV